MISPAVARIVADAVLGRHDPVLDVLGHTRSAGRLVPEPQLVQGVFRRDGVWQECCRGS